MAIQVRRGLFENFNPAKMLPGEWAVSIDRETEKQIVWMCFAAGVVKRMGTYEDFHAQIAEASDDIVNQFIIELTEAQEQLQNGTETYIQGKVDDDWIPTIQSLVTKAQESEEKAAASATAAKKSEDNANASKTAAADSAFAAATSATNADKSASAAKQSETNANASKNAAATSATNAAASEKAANDSKTAAANSASQASESADSASDSAVSAKQSETNAATSKTAAATSASQASTSASNAAKSATAADASKTAAAASATSANDSKTAAASSAASAKQSETNAADWSNWSKSYAIGEGGKRAGEATDNAKYYYEQAMRIAQGLEGSLLPMGTITFDKLATVTKSPGYMYNISNAFTSDSTFKDGGGIYYGAGNNVYYTVDKYWDVMASTGVTGIKGNNEVTYRLGNVEITPNNLKLPPTFAAAAARANVAANDPLDIAFGKLARYCADLKSVAFTGKYSDLEGLPSIPAAANDGTLTINQNNTLKGTFRANQSTNTTINLSDTDTKYSAGAGLSLDGTTFSANIANDLTTTKEGYALDARQGAALKASIDKLNTDMITINGYMDFKKYSAGTKNIYLTQGTAIILAIAAIGTTTNQPTVFAGLCTCGSSSGSDTNVYPFFTPRSDGATIVSVSGNTIVVKCNWYFYVSIYKLYGTYSIG